MSIVGVVNSMGQIISSNNLNSKSQQPMITTFLFYENRKENLIIVITCNNRMLLNSPKPVEMERKMFFPGLD